METCDLFPHLESPLSRLENDPVDAGAMEAIFLKLRERGLLNEQVSGASSALRHRLIPVSECQARVVVRIGGEQRSMRSFYLADGFGVEYEREGQAHWFGPPRAELDLASELARRFNTAADVHSKPLKFTASEYLVFAVFARDARKPVESSHLDDTPMTVDEVLAYFDEAEEDYTAAPSDDAWQKAVDVLCQAQVLVRQRSGYGLHDDFLPLAREIIADKQFTVMRFDFLDDQWLVREVNIYPTQDTAYSLGTESDGSVSIVELSTSRLNEVLSGVITTLPDALASAEPLAT